MYSTIMMIALLSVVVFAAILEILRSLPCGHKTKQKPKSDLRYHHAPFCTNKSVCAKSQSDDCRACNFYINI